MMNFNNSKTKQKIAAVIVVVIILAMVVTTILSALYSDLFIRVVHVRPEAYDMERILCEKEF